MIRICSKSGDLKVNWKNVVVYVVDVVRATVSS